ncbi:MAG: RNA degradosome polyphosphate kinase, partial [Oscillospiraceae bacterium]|nr:RNA degradosome polyphosphate kinase [Oscillospiraceae bacterium]
SADFMTRNTLRRIEVAVVIKSPEIRQRVLHIFDVMLRDNVKARLQQSDGSYVRMSDSSKSSKLNAQEYFINEAKMNADMAGLKKPLRVKVRKRKR